MKNKIPFIMLIISALFSCAESPKNDSRVDRLPYFNDPTFNVHWMDEGDDRLEDFHKISPFQLINQNGETISEKTFEGKIYVTDFFFATCTGICPKMTKNMHMLQEEFLNDDDVMLLSHTVTPEADSVEVLKRYAQDKKIISNKWHLVTGDQKVIYKLGRKDYFVEEDLGIEKDDDDFLHTENFVLIDKNRHIRGIYNGLNKTSVRQLMADIKTLKKEG